MRQMLASLVLMLPLSAAAQDQGVSDACAVWARETGFAQSVADHDAAAFASYLHPDAVFVDGSGATRGAEAIAAGWAGIIAGTGVVLHWYPDAVDVGANGAIALSRGPYWMEDPSAPPGKRYRMGRFVSTWLRDEDGEWRVVFDGGGGNVPVAATADDIANLINARRGCPAF